MAVKGTYFLRRLEFCSLASIQVFHSTLNEAALTIVAYDGWREEEEREELMTDTDCCYWQEATENTGDPFRLNSSVP